MKLNNVYVWVLPWGRSPPLHTKVHPALRPPKPSLFSPPHSQLLRGGTKSLLYPSRPLPHHGVHVYVNSIRAIFIHRLLPFTLPLNSSPKPSWPVSYTTPSSESSLFLVPSIMETTMRLRNIGPMIPTTKMTAESKTGDQSIQGLGPYWYEPSIGGVGGRGMFRKWVLLSPIIIAPARLDGCVWEG